MGEVRDDETVFFCEQIVSDGDTTGAKRFIAEQNQIIGVESNNKVMYFPSIEHLIKFISNNFFELAKKDSSLRGCGLLEATCIKAISNDVNKHKLDLHDMCERVYQQEQEGKN